MSDEKCPDCDELMFKISPDPQHPVGPHIQGGYTCQRRQIDRLRRQLAQANAVIEHIPAALDDYYCQFSLDAEGSGMALVDVLATAYHTSNPDAGIAFGKQEMELLAEHIRYYKPAAEAAAAAAAAEAAQETPLE